MQQVGKDHYSLEEVKAKLTALSHENRLRLEVIAKLQAAKIQGDWEDLLSEGLNRIVTGVRGWPRGLEMAPFLTMVLKSIVSAQAKHSETVKQHEAEVQRSYSDYEEENTEATQGEFGLHRSPEYAVYAEEMLTRLQEELKTDPETSIVALAHSQGFSSSEIQSQFNLTQGRYDAARKRLSRVVHRLLSEESTA